ncbi:DUF1772 domain-containing protein [Actinomadura craniellae]|uniref:DUF1772 domain-containing protein n=1 Tax=Actinomadura craniellae TaxID=2231787 RepID=A0A365GV69_9ACTN|nr:DUF1772 domain-containing protein [Actinomadura craniellae]RAY10681.1 DUF1772 domain-containing protein [Actinomadura craniellae]
MSLALTLSRTVASLLLGLYAGGVFFVVIAPSLLDLPGPAYARYWQALNLDYGRAMPPLLLTALAALAATVFLSRHHGGLVLGLGVTALVLVVLTVVVTLAFMEPLNQTANSWNLDQLPADWRDVQRQWSNWHLVRTVAAVAAFGCLLAAHALDRR